MPIFAEVEELALTLAENERGLLAARLLESLSPLLDDEDGGIGEALRRDAELDDNPDRGISLEEFNERMKQRLR